MCAGNFTFGDQNFAEIFGKRQGIIVESSHVLNVLPSLCINAWHDDIQSTRRQHQMKTNNASSENSISHRSVLISGIGPVAVAVVSLPGLYLSGATSAAEPNSTHHRGESTLVMSPRKTAFKSSTKTVDRRTPKRFGSTSAGPCPATTCEPVPLRQRALRRSSSLGATP